MTGDYAGLGVNQNWVVESESSNARRDLRHLSV
jgi:hypothetical protein